MNKELIKQIEKLGFKEYIPGSHESYDRAWQKKLNSNQFINVNWYDLGKIDPKFAKEFPEIMHYKDMGGVARQDTYYSFTEVVEIVNILKGLLDTNNDQE